MPRKIMTLLLKTAISGVTLAVRSSLHEHAERDATRKRAVRVRIGLKVFRLVGIAVPMGETLSFLRSWWPYFLSCFMQTLNGLRRRAIMITGSIHLTELLLPGCGAIGIRFVAMSPQCRRGTRA